MIPGLWGIELFEFIILGFTNAILGVPYYNNIIV